MSSSNTRSSNTTNTGNIRPSKTLSARNVCSGKPVCANNVRPSRSICGSKVCQNKPTNDGNIRQIDLINASNVLPSKAISTNHICFVNSSLSTEQMSNTADQINLIKKIFHTIYFTEQHCFTLYFIFQSFRTILLLNTSEDLFFHQRHFSNTKYHCPQFCRI